MMRSAWKEGLMSMRELRIRRVRRSLLYVPGNSPNLVQNAAIFGPDVVMLDLEDSVPLDQKDAARALVFEALKRLDFSGVEVLVRVNGLDTPFAEADLEAAVRGGADGVRLPKAEDGDVVKRCDELLGELEYEHGREVGGTSMVVSIESARAVMNAYEIASASPRVVAVALGAEDFTADVGAERTRGGEELEYARGAILVAAKAAGVQAIDTIYPDVDDEEGLIEETRLVKRLGFDGKSLISPRQIEAVHRVFAPSESEIAWARRVFEAFEEARGRGLGVVSLDGRMIDRPVVERARRVLALAGEHAAVEVEGGI